MSSKSESRNNFVYLRSSSSVSSAQRIVSWQSKASYAHTAYSGRTSVETSDVVRLLDANKRVEVQRSGNYRVHVYLDPNVDTRIVNSDDSDTDDDVSDDASEKSCGNQEPRFVFELNGCTLAPVLTPVLVPVPVRESMQCVSGAEFATSATATIVSSDASSSTLDKLVTDDAQQHLQLRTALVTTLHLDKWDLLTLRYEPYAIADKNGKMELFGRLIIESIA